MDIIVEDDIIYIQGEESLLPGVLDKTIRALEYCYQHIEFNHMIRSNISTIINFTQLVREDLTQGYRGRPTYYLSWTDPISGIHDDKLFGTYFHQGTCIVLHKKAVQLLIENKSSIRMDIVDDVSLGEFFSHYPELRGEPFSSYLVNEDDGGDSLIYRNKSEDRLIDIERMKSIISKINS
jgi:hypothetical protein